MSFLTRCLAQVVKAGKEGLQWGKAETLFYVLEQATDVDHLLTDSKSTFWSFRRFMNIQVCHFSDVEMLAKVLRTFYSCKEITKLCSRWLAMSFKTP